MVSELGSCGQTLLNNCVEKTQKFPTFTWRCRNNSKSGFEAQCGNQREVELERQKLQRLYTQGAAANGSLAFCRRLASCQYQRWDGIYNQRLRTQKLLWLREKSRERRLLLGPKLKVGERILHLLINWQKTKWWKVNTSSLKLVWPNSKCKKDEDKRFQRDCTSTFNNDCIKQSSQKIFDKGTEFAGKYKKFCNTQGLQFYSTLIETKAAFAELTIRSLKKFFSVTWKIMSESTFTSYRSLLHFWIPERLVWLILKPKDVNISDLLSIL